ncbi:cholesterol oxidase substrate-binding domain-containing protein [Streptomyces sp. NPDC001340]
MHEFTSRYRERLEAYAALGRFLVNGSVEIRVTGLDDPADTGVEGARAPLPSAVWLDVLTLPGTPYAQAFLRELDPHRVFGNSFLDRLLR